MNFLRLLLVAAACGALPFHAATFGTVVTLVGGATDLVLDEQRNQLYLVNSAANRLEVYSLARRQFLNPVRTDSRPLALALSPDNRTLFVVCYDQSSLNVIDMDQAAITRRVILPARPQAVAAGSDGRVLITTIGTGTGNQSSTLLLFDPASGPGQDLSAIPLAPAGPQPPALAPGGRPALALNSALLASGDGRLIFGVNNLGGNRRLVFVYETVSATVLRSRNVAGASNVLAASPAGETFFQALNLYEADSMIVLAQQQAATARFAFPTTAAASFNLQQNQGGAVFAPDGSVLYAALNIPPVQTPPARANISRLLLHDPDNLLILDGIQLPEAVAGKMVISRDGRSLYALSESGFLVLPVGQLSQSPLAQPVRAAAVLTNDQCGVFAGERQAVIEVANQGRGRLTATAQLIPTAAATASAPIVASQPTPSGSNLTFRFNPQAARGLGTLIPHLFSVQANEAVNIPANIKVAQNNRNSESFGELIPIEVGAVESEGIWDAIFDGVRQRLYLANAGLNRVEVFDARARRFLPPIKVGPLPHSMALGTDGGTLYVANSGGEWLSAVDLDRMRQTGKVRMPALPLNAAVPLATPQLVASSQRGPQVVVSSGVNANTLWRVVEDQLLPRTLNPAVFGAATTVPGPSQTIASTPNGEFVFLLAGNGFAYLFDASADEWITGRQIFGPAQSGLLPLQGYFGPVAAGPRGQYYVANGIVLNSALTPQTGAGGGVSPPVRPGTDATGRPTASVAPAGPVSYARFAQPVLASATAAATLTESPLLEIVDVNSGNVLRSVEAIEGPSTLVVGAQLQRVPGRLLAVDATLSNAYAVTASGLQIIPLTGRPAPADRPLLTAQGVVNTASYQATIAPNGLVSVFGRNLGGEQAAGSLPLPTALGDTCVTLNNAPIPLLLSSSGQLNVQIPPALTPGRYPLVVRNLTRKTASAAVQITVSRYAPAVFADLQGRALIFHADGRPVTKADPAKRDRPIVMYAAGLGATTGGRVTAGEASPTEPLAVTGLVKVYFGDKRYAQAEVIVDWSGLAPGLVGVYQLNLRVPGFHMRGADLPVTVSIGGIDSPAQGPVVPVVAVD